MTDLKTLKDLRIYLEARDLLEFSKKMLPIIKKRMKAGQKNMECPVIYYEHDKLKAEAIKWVKWLNLQKGTYKYNLVAVDLFKAFFNLTEDDINMKGGAKHGNN